MASPTIIIFGATGNVGSSTALAAHKLGAKVVLALRDPKKPIPGLSVELEQAGGFERVQADLTQPETVEAAVRKTGATRAFTYNVRGTADHGRSAAEALKRAGIDLVVFLSAALVRGDIRAITPATGFLAFSHAQAEVALADVFGPTGYVAVRPAYFNTNSRIWAPMVPQGEVRIPYPDAQLDWLAPSDIGKVAASLLVRGLSATDGATDPNHVVLFGPKLISQRDAVGIVARAVGRDVRVVGISDEEAVGNYVKAEIPEAVAKILVKSLGDRARGGMLAFEDFDKGSATLRKYVTQPTSLEEWVEENKAIFM